MSWKSVETATGKNELLDFKNITKKKISFPYSSQECQAIRYKFPSDTGNDTVKVIVKFDIIEELIRSQTSMAVIFLMAEFWGFATTFRHTQKNAIRKKKLVLLNCS